MNKELKLLLIKIAQLPKIDQRWLLKQLTTEQRAQFNIHQGECLLTTANRFSKLPLIELSLSTQSASLPNTAKNLMHYPPPDIALI
ncbi:MAG: hypothetical protein PSV35_06660, partial [bacterium]|nr:hypothetical protein [bacterium]